MVRREIAVAERGVRGREVLHGLRQEVLDLLVGGAAAATTAWRLAAGRGAGRVRDRFVEAETAGDGALAKTSYLDSKSIEQAGADAELARLLDERQKLEVDIEKLKARKGELKPEEYDEMLEKLLVELATVNQKIKARQK